MLLSQQLTNRKRLLMSSFNYKKAIQAINYFAIKEQAPIDKMKVIKLIWLSDRYHLRQYGRPILMDQYYAFEYGPVASNTKDFLKEYDDFFPLEEFEYRDIYITAADKEHKIKSKNDTDFNVFSNSEIKTLDLIYSNFGGRSQFELKDLSHEYPEWKRYENDLNQHVASRFQMEYVDFFKNPKTDNHEVFSQKTEHLDACQEIAFSFYPVL